MYTGKACTLTLYGTNRYTPACIERRAIETDSSAFNCISPLLGNVRNLPEIGSVVRSSLQCMLYGSN